jgi:hypothetical protein
MDISNALNALDNLIDSLENGILPPPRVLAYGSAKAIVDELQELNKDKYYANDYVAEQLATFLWSFKALLLLNDGNGHADSEHFNMSREAIKALRSAQGFNIQS